MIAERLRTSSSMPLKMRSSAATDFFTVEGWTAIGLARYHVLFVIRLA
jgi:hypothetical protein